MKRQKRELLWLEKEVLKKKKKTKKQVSARDTGSDLTLIYIYKEQKWISPARYF